MQPAISIGTVLQNHYRIVQLLGQGGFGRTYLAEDQGRFNERCAIKEFVPIRGEDKFSDKATELFQREASVLYQIEHPQIPKFRATFEEEERLFLVQDYVEGPTYYDVLRQRRSQGRAFSETEVRQFLQQILPVLAHIHAKGIIHRDVSPDNIILRQQDNLPVLIDFGVVKEVVTRMQLEGVQSHATTVGKAGYAPSEQMQTGRAYPSSDLYALAVTAIVLLTGQEPQMLFDDVDAVWTWQKRVSVDPQLAAVLNKALSFRPGDRFQSVNEMAQALRAGGTIQGGTIQGGTIQDRAGGAAPLPSGMSSGQWSSAMPNPYPQTPPLSQMKTMAVGRANPDASSYTNQGNTTVNRPTTVRQGQPPRGEQPGTRMVMPSEREARPSLLENPWAVGGLALGLAAIAGFGGWAVVQTLDTAVTPTPTITSLPPLGSETTPTPTPKPTLTQAAPKPVVYEQPTLALAAGETKTVEGNMRQGDKVNYPFVAEAGQTLKVEQFEEDVRLSVIGPSGEPVDRRADGVFAWEGVLEEAGEYRIQLSPVQDVKSSDYRLSLTLNEAAPVEPAPSVTVPPDTASAPSPDPPTQLQVQSQQVTFPNGSDGILLANETGPGRVRRYIVNVQEGQILSVQVTGSQGGTVSFDVLMPGGEMVADASGIVWWEGMTVGGNYAIDVTADKSSEFTLEIRASEQLPIESGQ
jgi:serine/threonine protein kinase